ncbi:Succinate dehydrogenase assembly factor 4, mitochondrial [Erysiphe neolycopersici]|uniref:Succinate dehydrogenase assembly factor 4, mitochondrial n=1 Tax=Erysiphe neolycopersici TaxID=212602 RepID=A0A420HTI0_9PEZI|nr:Succinate dehydrogenase assembly factor 4, mitochondrial [Erysiphe neolycopersici]
MIRYSVIHLVNLTRRNLSTTSVLEKQITKSGFGAGPAPPRLPPEEQEEFERLQKLSTGAFSTPKVSETSEQKLKENQTSMTTTSSIQVEAKGDGQELHPDIRRVAKPEFEGERNPITGEIGGPKTEPIRWGSDGERGDWSYNGRVTDF